MLLRLLAMIATQQPQGPAPYWQQRVVYNISARLDEPTFTLRGTQTVKYHNNSPDTLRTISFHLYLNAFRPGSRWSDADSAEHNRRFNDLKDPDFGFNHVSNVKIAGVTVQAIYPLAPDSTIVRFRLPSALLPGDSIDVSMDWDARPSIPPRRQGRRGRSYDFAQWYPRVVAYDKYGWEEHALVPAGEFYGEFGDFYVKLDVPNDQVVGATGVPVCGDPGWQAANRARDSVRVGAEAAGQRPLMIRDYSNQTSSHECSAVGTSLSALTWFPARERKEILWVARDVHHFAMSMSPDYRYEGGEWNGTLVHVLYQPGDEATWGNGIVVNNTITMLKWLDFIFGKYPWPQMTVVHRIEGGGTEFPMMQMNGSPSLGLNLHEGGHTYLMGILANNEWKEGWLDEGFTSFQTTWYNELQSRNDGGVRALEVGILGLDLDNQSQPVSTVSGKFRDFPTYNRMIYSRGELFLHELRRMVGDSTMVEILRTYYARWQLRHVDENAFKAVAEEVTHRDLSTLFAQWLHDVVLTDYAVRDAKREQVAGGWRTTVNLQRNDPGVFPVMIAVYGESDTAYVSANGVAEREQVVAMTRSKPRQVMVDPYTMAHDWNMLNNKYVFRSLHWLFGRDVPRESYLDTWFSQRVSRDHLTVGIMPTLWYNDVGGVTVGYRTRSDYLGRFEQNTMSEFCGLKHFAPKDHPLETCGFSLSFGNPTWWRVPNMSQQLTAFRFEGRAGAGVRVEKVQQDHIAFGPTRTVGASLNWLATYDLAYLPRQLWDDGGSLEGAMWSEVSDQAGRWSVNLRATAAGGVMYRSPGGGFTTTHRYDAQAYLRPELEATATRTIGANGRLGVRAYVAGVFSNDQVLSQRRIFIASADPYQTMNNPFIRSVGAPLVRDDCWCRWHSPGGGNLRGYNTTFSTDRLLALNVELEQTLLKPVTPLASRIAVALFGDGGYTGASRSIGGVGDSTFLPTPRRWLADVGVGLRVTHRIGTTTWTTRLDFPIVVTDPQWAFAHRLTTTGLNRLLVSFSPVIR